MSNHDILSGSGINLPQPGPFHDPDFDEVSEPVAITAAAAQQSVLGAPAGGLVGAGLGAAPAGADALGITSFTMYKAQHGGWVVTPPAYGTPLAAFSSFAEAVDWLKDRVA